jgi:hypothetical protein
MMTPALQLGCNGLTLYLTLLEQLWVFVHDWMNRSSLKLMIDEDKLRAWIDLEDSKKHRPLLLVHSYSHSPAYTAEINYAETNPVASF